MKLKVLALGAAVASISCVTPCSAQLQIESPATPYPESRLAFQDSQVGQDVFGQAPAAASAAPSDDYFAPGAPGEGLGAPRSILADQPSAFTSTPQDMPQGTPPIAPPNTPPSVVPYAAPAQAPWGALAGTPEAGMVPVCWPDGAAGCRTPNPIADIMMRNWCTDGLWATYPAQRARECAHIQQHTGGYNRYTCGCETCAQGYPAQVWSAPPMSSFAQRETAAPVSVVEVPQKPVAQLVISPVMSAPSQLPTAQAAPVQAQVPVVPTQAVPAQTPPAPVQQYQATPSPLPADPLPADVPVVANRSMGFFR